MDLNKVTLIGNLTRDPHSVTLASGISASRFTVATGYTWVDTTSKERQHETLSANVDETPTPWNFSVEGETGNEDVHDHGGGAVGAGDRGGGEGGAPAVHGR